ncbi:hypothetical protein RRG08_038458 [Elysia crispata]|uniref:Uncharacterized protein n=1 Tax=Elysia crispata TaxID=231223 RepID=A0AAE0ZXK2_9GAST|nr:hypothetical protein RRG08_038458 [Elysia crispata]
MMLLQVGILGVWMSILSERGVFMVSEDSGKTHPVICTIEQMRDYPDVNNASLDILNTALDMAFGHMSPQKTGTLVLNRKYVTSATVFAITNGQLDFFLLETRQICPGLQGFRVSGGPACIKSISLQLHLVARAFCKWLIKAVSLERGSSCLPWEAEINISFLAQCCLN